MQTKITAISVKTYAYMRQLRDVRIVGLVLFLVVALLVTWSSIKIIDTNYHLQKQLSRLEQQNQVQQLKNENLKLQNTYYETDQYLELAARRNFGLAAPGETVLYIPTHVALAHTVDLVDPDQAEVQAAKNRQPAYQRNFQAWINFLLHRQTLRSN